MIATTFVEWYLLGVLVRRPQSVMTLQGPQLGIWGFEKIENVGKGIYYGGIGLAIIAGTVVAFKLFDVLFGD